MTTLFSEAIPLRWGYRLLMLFWQNIEIDQALVRSRGTPVHVHELRSNERKN